MLQAILEREILSVSALNAKARQALGLALNSVWVEAEISNFICASSGHWYFSLKDSKAQVRAAMFKNQNRQVGFMPKNGQQVLVHAEVSLYEERGDYQLIVSYIEEAGHGALQRAFETLRLKLSQEGLFETQHKKPLPTFPKTIGVITSPRGAAIRDILSTLKRRYSQARVIIYPCLVQGEEAAAQLRRALHWAQMRQECEVLIIARGGGSLEDLWAFNDEALARAIFACSIPIVSGVGHEIDFTLCDFVADLRAPTPTAAAEHCSPDQTELFAMLLKLKKALHAAMLRHLNLAKQHLLWQKNRLGQPQARLVQYQQQCDHLQYRLYQLGLQALEKKQNLLKSLQHRLEQQAPLSKLFRWQQKKEKLESRLEAALKAKFNECQKHLLARAQALHAISPLATLNRGYALALKNKHVIGKIQDLKLGDSLQIRLAQGELDCQIKEIKIY